MTDSSDAKRKRLYHALLILILLAGLTGMPWLQPPQAAGVHGDGTGDPGAAAIEAAQREAWSHQLSVYAGASTGPQQGLETAPTPAAESGLPTASGSRWWGLQLYPSSFQVAPLQQLGAGWLRMPLGWAWIEPVNTTPEHYNWPTSFDEQIAELSASGVQVVFTLTANPSWAATYGAGPIDRVDIGELVQFMQAAVAHYGAPPYNVKHWEIYNEPDNADVDRAAYGGWGYFGHQPDKYVEVLAALYQPIKQVDPDAQVVFGGLAYDNWIHGFVKEFLDGVLAHGGGAYFDVMNFHYFTYYKSVWDPYGIDIIGKTNYIRDKLTSFGVTKSFVVTEACKGSNTGFGTEELQSRYVAQLFARSKAAGLDLTIWWWLRDDSTIAMKCGLLNDRGLPKPAWYAYQVLAEQLTSTDYVRTLPATETGSSQIEAYQFRTIDGSHPILVAWTNDSNNHVMSVNADYAVVVDKMGIGTEVRDGDDGQVDGRVQVTLRPSPQYVRLQSEYGLTITTAGSGTVLRVPDKASYRYGDLVTLTPLPAAGWGFDKWEGASAPEVIANGDGSWSLEMDGDKVVTALFRPGPCTLTIDILGEGTVNRLPTGPLFEGDVVKLTPAPAPGWVFDRWLGTNVAELVDRRDGSWSLTMNGNKAVTARFLRAQYYLTVTVEGQGNVGYLPGPYLYGNLATLTPVPAKGWTFGAWRGTNGSEVVNNGDNTWSIVMTSNKTVTAKFFEGDRLSLFLPEVLCEAGPQAASP